RLGERPERVELTHSRAGGDEGLESARPGRCRSLRRRSLHYALQTSIIRTYALASRLRASWMEARVTKVARVSVRFSKSLSRRRLRPNQEKGRSTTQRRGRDDEALHVVAPLDDLHTQRRHLLPRHQPIALAAGRADAPIYDRAPLGAGGRIAGPAILTHNRRYQPAAAGPDRRGPPLRQLGPPRSVAP